MTEFSRVLLSWQPFYTTIASASATLVGLLFVSLTVQRNRLEAEALSAARRTFANLLDVLLIALIFLVPHADRGSLSAAMLVFGFGRGLVALRDATAKRKSSVQERHHKIIRLEMQRSLFSGLGLVLLSAAIAILSSRAMFLPVAVIVVLIASAGKNAWELLVKE